ncbi:MAG: hypothetical protein ACXWK8_12635 [Myxococcaceae bacterium]
MRIRYAALLAPVALTIACSDEGPIQNTGPKLTISPATVSVETGADAIPLQAIPQNGDLTGSVTWSVLSGSGGTLGQSSGTTNTFTPSDLGTAGGAVVIKATATVGGGVQPATSAVTVVPSTRGRIALGIDPGQTQAVGGAGVDISELDGGSKVTFTASAPTVLRSRIIDAGTYLVTADAGIVVPGNLVDGTWDGTVTFDGGTPARSVQVPVTPNFQTNVLVTFAQRGGLGRMWVPAGGGILGYTETELLVDHASQTGLTAAGARAVAFDADGNLWATFSDGVRMYPPGALSDPNAQPTKTVTLANATGIAIRGATVAVGSCSGSNGGVSTFTRTDATPSATATPISVGCVWGLSYDAGNNGKLWVVSKSGSKVYRFASPTGSIDLAGVTLTDAYGIAVDGSGNAWVSSCSGNSVQQISAAGVVGSPIALTDFPCPGGLALDKQGTLWILSAGAGNGTSGSLVSLNGSTPGPQLNSLTQVLFGGIAFDPAAATLPVHQ